jgi:hypothetical protein
MSDVRTWNGATNISFGKKLAAAKAAQLADGFPAAGHDIKGINLLADA